MSVKRFTAAVLCAVFIIILTSCGAQKKEKTEVFYSFTDYANREITLEKKPEKVAVLFSSFADMWQMAGGEIYVTVGESVERGFAEDGVLLADGGAGKTIDTELLISYAPDFVICSADIAAQEDAAKMLCDAGIDAAVFRVESFEDYMEVFGVFTDITENKQAYKKYAVDVREKIEKIKNAARNNSDKKDILFIRAGSKYSSTKAKTKDNNFVCVMLDELGTHNIAEDAPVLLDGLSLEEVIRRDPDYIFISTMGDEEAAKAYMEEVFSDEVWSSISAVKSGKYTYLEKDLFQYKPNAKWDVAYEKLFNLIWK